MTLAVTASILALLGCDVSVACYSKYLCTRDYNNFVKLFEQLGIVDKIYYGTFNELSERRINKRIDIRKGVEELFNGRSIDRLLNNEKDMPIEALLIDEVDVFFSKEFFGRSYSPQVKI